MNNYLYLAISGLISVVEVDWIFSKVQKVAKVIFILGNLVGDSHL